jgi:hypothetical protein
MSVVNLGCDSRGNHDLFYCLRFETPLTWRARSPYLYPPRTEWPNYTPRHWVSFSSPPTTRSAAVEVFEPTSTRRNNSRVRVKVNLRLAAYRKCTRKYLSFCSFRFQKNLQHTLITSTRQGFEVGKLAYNCEY